MGERLSKGERERERARERTSKGEGEDERESDILQVRAGKTWRGRERVSEREEDREN